MRLVYKRSLTFIGLLIILIACVGVGYLFYDQVIHPETEVAVIDELSINYLDGSSVISNGEFRFSVTNNGSSDIYYRIILTDIKGMDHDVTYSLTSSDANASSSEKTLEDGENVALDNVLIKGVSTQNFTLKVSNNTSTTFKISIDKIETQEEYFYMTILSQNDLREALSTPGEEVSSSNEGLISSLDDDGTTYYFRGSALNNYVSFAGLTWRIVRINGDGTVRLVLNDVADTLVNYNSDAEGYDMFNETSFYESLTAYYNNTLSNYDSSIANTKFCSESGNTDGTYNAYTRIVTNQIPTFNCLGERYTSKIGVLSVDEVVYAGALYGEENTSYYLYNEDIENLWWTSSLSKSNENAFYPFLVDTNGELVDDVEGTLYRNFRPVISLSRNVTVTGSGTSEDPYVVN